MAIYETSSLQPSAASHSSRVLAKIAVALLLAGPKRVMDSGKARSDPYSRGSNEVTPWGTTFQTTVSIGMWCTTFLWLTGKTVLKNHPAYTRSSCLVENSIRTTAKALTEFCRTFVRRAFGKKEIPDDLTITLHKGSCQCGSVQFQAKAPRTLYVNEPNNIGCDKDGLKDGSSSSTTATMIQYPTTCIPVESFVLKQGQRSLKSFYTTSQKKAAHTFCAKCGVHILRVLEPDAPELYLNVYCLRRGTFTAKVVVVAPQKKTKEANDTNSKDDEDDDGFITNTKSLNAAGSSPTSSNDDGELIVAPEQKDDEDPIFTVTAASSISSPASSMDSYVGDDVSTSQLEVSAYRLRRALNADGRVEEEEEEEGDIVGKNSRTNDDANDSGTSSHAGERYELRKAPLIETTSSSSSRVPAAFSPSVTIPMMTNSNSLRNQHHQVSDKQNAVMLGSFMAVAPPPAPVAVADSSGEDEVVEERISFHQDSSYASSSTDGGSPSADEETQEQLRRFMSKHVKTPRSQKKKT